MTNDPAQTRTALRNDALLFLDKLRTAFPLEQRIEQAAAATRNAYGRVLIHWIEGKIPALDLLSPVELQSLSELDAIVPGAGGIGCYPFSIDDRGIRVRLGHHCVSAMCAIDALAMARLARTVSMVEARCVNCLNPVTCEVQADGSLQHEACGAVRVLWRNSVRNTHSCSDGLCRDLIFLCQRCMPPDGGECLTLPQATAVANAFFRFQHRLILTA